MPNQGDVVLIPVPFTDLTSQKRRPVIVKTFGRVSDATLERIRKLLNDLTGTK